MRPTVSSTSSDSPAGLQLPCSRSAPRTVVARPRAPGAPPPAARRPPSAPAPSALREGAASRPRAQGGGLRTARARFLGQLQPGKGGQLTAPLQGWGRKDPHHRPAQRQWGDRRRVVLVTGVRCVKLLKVCRIWGGGAPSFTSIGLSGPEKGRILRPPRLSTRRWANSSLGYWRARRGRGARTTSGPGSLGASLAPAPTLTR